MTQPQFAPTHTDAATPLPPPTSLRSGLQRAAAAFFGLFLLGGVTGPYMSLALTHMGYSHGQIGGIMAGASLCSVVAPLAAGVLADRCAGVNSLLRAAATATVLLACMLGWIASSQHGPNVAYVGLLMTFYFARAPLGCLLDTIGMEVAQRRAAIYGRLRLSGSLSYMVAAAGAGWLLRDGHYERFFPAVCALALVGCGASLLSPTVAARRGSAAPCDGDSFWHSLDRPFVLWLGAMMLHWMAFSPYQYGFTMLLQEQRIAEDLYGVLVSLAVIAEIAAFLLCDWFFQRLTSHQVLLLALTANMLRWALLGSAPSLTVIAATQLLHAPGFGLYYAAAMQTLGQRRQHLGSYQGLFTTLVTGLSASVGIALCGWLHEHMPLRTVFLCMLPVQGAALLLLWASAPAVQKYTLRAWQRSS